MVNPRTVVILGTLAGIGAAIYWFRDQIGALIAPPSECPSGFLLDTKSGVCCKMGSTYNPATGQCERSVTTPSGTAKTTSAPTPVSSTSKWLEIAAKQVPVSSSGISAGVSLGLLTTPAPSTPVGSATPSLTPPPTALTTEQAGNPTLMNFYFNVQLAGKPLSGARIDVAGQNFDSSGILYTDSTGKAGWLQEPTGIYGFVVYYNGKKQSEGSIDFTYDGQICGVGLSNLI